jgi:hypothetical protein
MISLLSVATRIACRQMTPQHLDTLQPASSRRPACRPGLTGSTRPPRTPSWGLGRRRRGPGDGAAPQRPALHGPPGLRSQFGHDYPGQLAVQPNALAPPYRMFG